MGGFSSGKSSGGGNQKSPGHPSQSYNPNKNKPTTTSFGSDNNKGKAVRNITNFIKGGGITGVILRGITGAIKNQKTKNKKDKSGNVYSGAAYGYNEAKEKKDYKPQSFDTRDNKNNKPQGIELAKASTTSATILGPAEIQKQAANEIKGPTITEMSEPLTASQILLANKRKGRRTTNITAKKTLDKNYTLSKKTLLG